ncbi:hypothetical protein AXK59_10280 [Tsukamurella tyrosinosolvens]|nr:hypothetical protein AXK59_10280 [Tsukamurella tyrosinosolvens]KZL95706.1 hypothetical protein AXX05_21370 [Tsukamurella tyrosinosolvens]
MSGIPGFARWEWVCRTGKVERVPASPIEKDLSRRLGLRLRQLREDRGFTQESIAAATGIDPKTYGGYENGMSDYKTGSHSIRS